MENISIQDLRRSINFVKQGEEGWEERFRDLEARGSPFIEILPNGRPCMHFPERGSALYGTIDPFFSTPDRPVYRFSAFGIMEVGGVNITTKRGKKQGILYPGTVSE